MSAEEKTSLHWGHKRGYGPSPSPSRWEVSWSRDPGVILALVWPLIEIKIQFKHFRAA